MVKRMSANEFIKNFDAQNGEIIDVRTPAEFHSGHVKGAKNLDFLSGQFSNAIDSLDKSKTYYLYCASGGRSGNAGLMLYNAGFDKVYNLGGFMELEYSGVEVEY